MADEKIVIVCIPSLVSTLLNREQKKGSPLTREEVAEIYGSAPAIALPEKVAAEVEAKRGYPDLDVHSEDQCWEAWQKARLELA